MTINQRRAYSEIIEIIKKMPLEIKSKIPENIIENIKSQKDNEWKFEYDKTIALENQKILYTTKVLFSYIYMNYIASKEKKEELKSIYEKNSREKYNTENIFSNRKKVNANVEEKKEVLLEVRKEKFFKKLINYIKSWFVKTKKND